MIKTKIKKFQGNHQNVYLKVHKMQRKRYNYLNK
jgi:hypothetical protein